MNKPGKNGKKSENLNIVILSPFDKFRINSVDGIGTVLVSEKSCLTWSTISIMNNVECKKSSTLSLHRLGSRLW